MALWVTDQSAPVDGSVTTATGSRDHSLRRRRRRQIKDDLTKPMIETAAHISKMLLRKQLKPTLQRRYIILIVVVLMIVVGILIAYFSQLLGSSSPKAREQLYPPDPETPQPPSYSIEHRFKRAAVCSDGPPCAAIGRDILLKNGSVIDAAIATLFCNGLVNCHSMGVGGGFLMTLYLRDSQTAITLNARETAPLQANADMYIEKPKLAKTGPLAIGVPGELKGYHEAHRKYGRLPWADLVEPTIQVCQNGFNMSKHMANSLTFKPEYIHNDPLLREMFIDPRTGNFRKPGSLIKNEKYCETLKTIAKMGAEDFYTGTLAKTIVADIQEKGGIITEDDLASYRVKWEEPLSIDMRNGDRLYSVPPPGSGALLAFIINILEGYNMSADSVGTINDTIITYHRMIEAFKYAFGKRTKLGDPSFVNITAILNNMTSKEHASYIRSKINDTQTSSDPGSYGAVSYNVDDHGTAHVSIIAPNGDAASITSTVNFYFGAGFTSRQTGIIFNNGMDDFAYPNFENYFGLPYSETNCLTPGKRSLSSMSPAIIVDKNNEPKLVIGASGGTKIPTAVAYTIARHLWFGEGIKKAVDASRIHHQLYPMEINYEYGVLNQIIKGLQKLGHKTERFKARSSIICALSREGSTIVANADYRKSGDVSGF